MDYLVFQNKLQNHSNQKHHQELNHYSDTNLLEDNQETRQSFIDGATWVYENYEHYLRDNTIIHTASQGHYSTQETRSTNNQEIQQEMFSAGVTWAIEVLSSRKGLYRFFAYIGHIGTLEGAFLAITQEIDTLIGQHVFFGRILNNEHNISFTIKPEHIMLVTDDEHVVNILEQQNFCVGVNPIDYLT